jgi:hypothetical protein
MLEMSTRFDLLKAGAPSTPLAMANMRSMPPSMEWKRAGTAPNQSAH